MNGMGRSGAFPIAVRRANLIVMGDNNTGKVVQCKWQFKIDLTDDCAGIIELSDEYVIIRC